MEVAYWLHSFENIVFGKVYNWSQVIFLWWHVPELLTKAAEDKVFMIMEGKSDICETKKTNTEKVTEFWQSCPWENYKNLLLTNSVAIFE